MAEKLDEKFEEYFVSLKKMPNFAVQKRNGEHSSVG